MWVLCISSLLLRIIDMHLLSLTSLIIEVLLLGVGVYKKNLLFRIRFVVDGFRYGSDFLLVI